MDLKTLNKSTFLLILQEDANSINSQYYIPGALSRQKQEELGTPDAVQETRRSHVVKHKHEKGKSFSPKEIFNFELNLKFLKLTFLKSYKSKQIRIEKEGDF